METQTDKKESLNTMDTQSNATNNLILNDGGDGIAGQEMTL